MPTPTTRRPRGSGSITFDKRRQLYRIRWPIAGQPDGSEYVAGSRIDADQVLRDRLAERDRSGGVRVDRRMTVGAWVETWLAGHVAGKAIGTRIRYADISRRVIVPKLGRIRLAELSAADLRRFRVGLIQDGYTRRGADSVLDVLGAALGIAKRDRLVPYNVRTDVDREPKARRSIDPPTPAEQDALLQAVAGDPVMYAAFALTIGHGLRSSELLGLRHGDRVGDRLAIDRKREYRTGDTSEEPKDGSARVLRLAPWVADALDRLPRATPAAPLFPGARPGTTIHPHTLLDRIHQLSGELGLRRRYTWHDLRRAYGTRIAASNSPAAVTAAMGHADYRTSLIYIAPADVVDDWTPGQVAR